MFYDKSNFIRKACLGAGIGSVIGALVPVIFNATGIIGALTHFVSPLAFFAFLRRLVTLPLQLAPARFTRPGLLLPFFLPSAKFSTT